MPNNEGTNSELYAYQIIDHLVQLGITYFCIAPGSRSSALTLAAASHPKVETLVHFDERGLAFHALGYSFFGLVADSTLKNTRHFVDHTRHCVHER